MHSFTRTHCVRMVSENVAIAICIVVMTVTGAVQAILMPLILMDYESIYFVSLWTSVQFFVFFGVIYFWTCRRFSAHKISMPSHKLTIVLSGIFSALMSILKVYSSHPNRTPPVMQAILASLSILPNVFFTKVILKKVVRYDKRFIIPSCVFMAASVGISLVPLSSSWSAYSVLWILMYSAGTLSRSAYCIFQEKYFIDTGDTTLLNQVVIMFYTRVVHLIVVIPFFWLDYFIGNTSTPWTSFANNFIAFFTRIKDFGMFEGFIIGFMVFYVFSVYLNGISSNFNMIATIAVSPSVGIFFTVFSGLNPGVYYPWYIVVPALCCSVASIILWIIGEKRDGYIELEDAVTKSDCTPNDATKCCN